MRFLSIKPEKVKTLRDFLFFLKVYLQFSLKTPSKIEIQAVMFFSLKSILHIKFTKNSVKS